MARGCGGAEANGAVEIDEERSAKNPHKHDTGEADLEKVTDYVEEKEFAVSASVGWARAG